MDRETLFLEQFFAPDKVPPTPRQHSSFESAFGLSWLY